MSDIAAVKDKFAAQIAGATELRALDNIRVSALGKKGEVSKMMQGPVSYTHLTLPTTPYV